MTSVLNTTSGPLLKAAILHATGLYTGPREMRAALSRLGVTKLAEVPAWKELIAVREISIALDRIHQAQQKD